VSMLGQGQGPPAGGGFNIAVSNRALCINSSPTGAIVPSSALAVAVAKNPFRVVGA
jgi:hypothetical protein